MFLDCLEICLAKCNLSGPLKYIGLDGKCKAPYFKKRVCSEAGSSVSGYEVVTIFTSIDLPSYFSDDEFHCEQYENMPGSCNARKAWLCQYAEWRVDFYTVWMKEYMEHKYVQCKI